MTCCVAKQRLSRGATHSLCLSVYTRGYKAPERSELRMLPKRSLATPTLWGHVAAELFWFCHMLVCSSHIMRSLVSHRRPISMRVRSPHTSVSLSLYCTATLLHYCTHARCMGDRTCLSARLLSRGEEGDHGATLMRTDRVVLNARLGVCTATLPPMGPLLACTHWRWRYWAARPTLWPVRAARAQ